MGRKGRGKKNGQQRKSCDLHYTNATCECEIYAKKEREIEKKGREQIRVKKEKVKELYKLCHGEKIAKMTIATNKH